MPPILAMYGLFEKQHFLSHALPYFQSSTGSLADCRSAASAVVPSEPLEHRPSTVSVRTTATYKEQET